MAISSAKKTFETFNCKNIDRKINKNKNCQNQKPWFDQDCKFARQKYRKSKRSYKLNNTIRNRSIMIDDEKGYKKDMNEKYKIYCKKISDDLKNASRDNPKHFWKILGEHKRKQQPNIEINTLYKFFKDLNTKGPDEQESTTLHNELPNDSNVHINGYISQNEIFKCIKNLKNNKACGEDEIINEYIKSTSNRFIHIYEKLFNIIFDTGILPQSWLNGIIKPIY